MSLLGKSLAILEMVAMKTSRKVMKIGISVTQILIITDKHNSFVYMFGWQIHKIKYKIANLSLNGSKFKKKVGNFGKKYRSL